MPSRWVAAWMMRMLAWWGMTRARSSALMPAEASAFSAESTTTRTARRKISLPSMVKNPPCSQASRSAAEPSAPSTAMLRSVQSTQRDRCSAPITRTRLLPVSSRPYAVRMAYMNPLQAAFTSIAGHVRPNSAAIMGAVAGAIRSGVVVASTRKSMSEGSTKASSMARFPATTPRDFAEPPMRRSRIPVRSVIHSSVVSRVLESSSLVTIRSGTAMPHPLKRTPMVSPFAGKS